MAIAAGTLIRPPIGADYRGTSTPRSWGLFAGTAGLALAMIAFVSSLILAAAVAADVPLARVAAQDAWTFGVATAALGTLKVGIALILWGIARRLWIRVESVKAALPGLVPESRQPIPITQTTISTPYGAATVSRYAPGPLFIHRVAFALWAPMLIMGAMLVGLGLVIGLAASANAANAATFLRLRTLEPGVMFLGEGLLLSGIAFLLGSILGSIRIGGGEVQESLGVAVKTLKMPFTAKVFVALMALGMMVEMAQVVLYIIASGITDEKILTVWLAWLGPLREAGLGVLLTSIVLALASIAKALSFQFTRITELVASGR